MDGRRAYEALILGILDRDYRPNYEKIRFRVLRRDYQALLRENRLTLRDTEILDAAREYEKAIKQKLEGTEASFDSIYDLLLFHEFVDLWAGGNKPGRGQNIYRGQCNSSWPLVPTLYRSFHEPAELYEHIKVGAQAVMQFGLSRNIQLKPEQVLAVLQHYGYATPLLDFTVDVRIAAAFACRRPTKGVEYGAIYKINLGDCEALMPKGTTALGRMVSITTDEIPRIRIQKGVFFTGFKSLLLQRFTSMTKYSFRHGSDSESFGQVVGLSDEVLFPDSDELESILGQAKQRLIVFDKCRPDTAAAIRNIVALTREDAFYTQRPLVVEDYVALAKTWVDWKKTSRRRRREILVLVRWFTLLQQTDLPLLCKSMNVLFHGVTNIEMDPYITAEDASDIEGRLVASGRGRDKGSVAALFKLARKQREQPRH